VSLLLQAAETNLDVSTGDAEWLKRKLQNSNNKSQLDRLLDIAGSVPDLMRDLVGDPGAMGSSGPRAAYSWAQWVAKARNTGSAHPGSRGDPLSAYWAAESLRWVLLAALLNELAVPDVLPRLAQDSGYQVCREHVHTAMPQRP